MDPECVDEFMNAIQSEYPVEIWIHENNLGILVLDKIVVDAARVGEGKGTRVMNKVIVFADAHQKTIVLTPSSSFGRFVVRLRVFFRRFGFLPNAGRRKDYQISDTSVLRTDALTSIRVRSLYRHNKKERAKSSLLLAATTKIRAAELAG